MSSLDQTITLLDHLIAFPTVSSDSNLALIADLATRLEDAGARVDLFHDASGQKANLFATLGPDTDGGIVLSGHTDVVPVTDQVWTSDPFAMARRGDKLFGRGTCDMKGFIAAAVALAPTLATQVRNRPLHFAFTYEEEVGCIGAQALADSLRAKGVKPAVAIIGEPTSMGIIEGHKGCCEYTTRIEGLAGHGSAPHRGVNAVEYAVRYVARLLELREDLKARTPKSSRFDPPWTTINPGALHGGIAHNVIADHATVDWEMRPVQESDGPFVRDTMRSYVSETLLPAMQAVWPDAAIHTETMGEVAGLEPVDDNEARRIVSELTGANTADLVAFGTEAGIFQSLGMDVVVCGPGSIEQAHKPDEFVEIDQLAKCLTMLEGLGTKLAAS
ncbi:acetylornithine deacetylase [Aquicoccus sp. G2-2]|uniref:acetylornithine deacetylase n=1 Tax=Aquicoccus sp. G2-2 TaxID=3092120 RepID=UPI002ADF561D|nr:acetylornithine deacetylase [Aquicoccus sp. G2-2]MEA1114163.1 acetylornithine deacetylase [Aquicoccus sp. G2-2]